MEQRQRNAAASGASWTTDKTKTLRLGVRLQLTKVQSAAWLTEKQEVGRRTMKEMVGKQGRRMLVKTNGVSGVWMVADLSSNERQREGATAADLQI